MIRGPHKMRATMKIFVASMLVALAIAGPASAASVTQEGYTLRAGVTEQQISKNTPPQAPKNVAQVQQKQQASDNGSLPFTGLQLSIVLAVGVALLGAGLTVRRMAGGPTQA